MKSYEVNYHFTNFTDDRTIHDSMIISVPNDFPITKEYFEIVCKPSYINPDNYKVDKFWLVSNNKLEF